jgi:hypothetical protein
LVHPTTKINKKRLDKHIKTAQSVTESIAIQSQTTLVTASSSKSVNVLHLTEPKSSSLTNRTRKFVTLLVFKTEI